MAINQTHSGKSTKPKTGGGGHVQDPNFIYHKIFMTSADPEVESARLQANGFEIVDELTNGYAITLRQPKEEFKAAMDASIKASKPKAGKSAETSQGSTVEEEMEIKKEPVPVDNDN